MISKITASVCLKLTNIFVLFIFSFAAMSAIPPTTIERQASERLSKSLTDAGNVNHHINKGHGFKLVDGVKEFWKSKEFSDVLLKTDSGEIEAHRIILASFSSFFKAMFGSDMIESGQRTIDMYGIDHVTLESVLGFIYTGEIDITGQSVTDILAVSNFLGLESLVKSCGEFLIEHMKPENSLDILFLADSQGIKGLLDAAKQYVLFKFTDVVKREQFLEFPVSFVSELLKDDLICVVKSGFVPSSHDQEVFIVETVIRYINYRLEDRKQHLATLLGCVRLSQMKPSDLHDLLSTNNLIRTSPDAIKVIQSALKESEGNKDSAALRPGPRKFGGMSSPL